MLFPVEMLWEILGVKVTQSNQQFGYSRWILIAVVAGNILAGIIILVQSMPSKAVRKKQAAFLVGLEKRSPARIQRLVSENYTDRWEFNRDDIVATMLDAGSQFLVLVVRGEEVGFEQQDGVVTVTMDLTISGKPVGPAGQEVMRRINQLNTPFVFTWKKENFLPTSWRLISIDNETLPDELYGYEPGSLRRAMRGE